MNEAAFSQLIEETLAAVEEAIDNSGANLDYDTGDGILTITCEDSRSAVIISKQTPLRQLWVAAKSGGYHHVYENGQWRCTITDETLPQLLSRVCSEQSRQPVTLALE